MEICHYKGDGYALNQVLSFHTCSHWVQAFHDDNTSTILPPQYYKTGQ